MGVRQLLSDLLPPSPPPPRRHFLQPPNSSRRRSSAPPSEMKVGRHIYRLLQLLKQERRCLFGSELLIIRQNSSTPNPNSSHSSPNQQSKLICVWSKSPADKCWAVVMEITFIIVGSTQELDQDITRRGVGEEPLFSGGTVAGFLCGSWRGSALDQLWVTRAPGWGDGAESISTRLLEPAAALIVITRPGPISTNHLCNLQMWNYEAAVHRRERSARPRRSLCYCDYVDGFTRYWIMSEAWRWFLETTFDRDLPVSDLRYYLQMWKYGGLFIYFACCRCSLKTGFGSFRLIFNPKINI